MITVYYNGKPYQYADSTKYLELARTLQPQFEHDIVLASVNGKLQELWKYMKDGANVSFLTTQSQAGIMAYRRSVVLLLLKALKDTISKERLGSNQVKVEFSLSKGLFCHFCFSKLLYSSFSTNAIFLNWIISFTQYLHGSLNLF